MDSLDWTTSPKENHLVNQTNLEAINQNLEEENMILKNEVEILKMQLKESDQVCKDLSKQLESAHSEISAVSGQNTDLKSQVDKLLKEIEILKDQSKEQK